MKRGQKGSKWCPVSACVQGESRPVEHPGGGLWGPGATGGPYGGLKNSPRLDLHGVLTHNSLVDDDLALGRGGGPPLPRGAFEGSEGVPFGRLSEGQISTRIIL